jgi:hypothetical protein
LSEVTPVIRVARNLLIALAAIIIPSLLGMEGQATAGFISSKSDSILSDSFDLSSSQAASEEATYSEEQSETPPRPKKAFWDSTPLGEGMGSPNSSTGSSGPNASIDLLSTPELQQAQLATKLYTVDGWEIPPAHEMGVLDPPK